MESIGKTTGIAIQGHMNEDLSTLDRNVTLNPHGFLAPNLTTLAVGLQFQERDCPCLSVVTMHDFLCGVHTIHKCWIGTRRDKSDRIAPTLCAATLQSTIYMVLHLLHCFMSSTSDWFNLIFVPNKLFLDQDLFRKKKKCHGGVDPSVINCDLHTSKTYKTTRQKRDGCFGHGMKH